MRLLLATIMVVGAALTACATPAASTAPTVPPVATTTTTVTTSSAIAEPPPPPPPCAPTIRACVSLSLKQAWLLTSGVIDYGPVPISHGAANSPTPTGTFPVSWKDADNTSSIYRTRMPNSVFFAPGGIAFHEGSITEPSHGCVRLAPDAAKFFFDHLTRGQLVQVVT